MKIALVIPAYRQQMHVETARVWAQDALTTVDLGWQPVMFWTDMNSIEVARNNIVREAERAECRLLLMCDSDTAPTPLEGGLRSMWKAMQDTGAAVVGAAVPIRNGETMNCEPAKPGEVYPGVVGTGYVLLDLFKLRNVPKPWFRCVLSEDGTSKALGSDIGFCRLVQEHGLTVAVNYALPMAHVEQSAVATRV